MGGHRFLVLRSSTKLQFTTYHGRAQVFTIALKCLKLTKTWLMLINWRELREKFRNLITQGWAGNSWPNRRSKSSYTSLKTRSTCACSLRPLNFSPIQKFPKADRRRNCQQWKMKHLEANRLTFRRSLKECPHHGKTNTKSRTQVQASKRIRRLRRILLSFQTLEAIVHWSAARCPLIRR